ncbi:unnamed protein product [Polarella glacialis]|uniref:Uncharacterized protein n=1 Tax=Polarella glacialis TaxID=89957 RepID=A0A813GFE8_POLGL|nr:unnamed protein product [Polarella glacialis]
MHGYLLALAVWQAPSANNQVGIRFGCADEPHCLQGYSEEEFVREFGNTGCPSTCEYKNACATTGTLQCVAAGACYFLQTGGRPVPGNVSNETDGSGLCLGCDIVGCKVCASTQLCEMCKDDYSLKPGEGSCKYNRQEVWYIAIPVFGVLCTWFWVDAIRAHCRPTTNLKALQAGLVQRFRTKVRQRETGFPLYPLISAPMHTQVILGLDLALFMNWFVLVGLVAAWLTVLAVIFSPRETAPVVEDICVLLERSATVAASYQPLVVPNEKWWTGLSYGGSVLISALFMLWQRRNLDQLILQRDCATPMLHNYAVEVHGFPPEATDHAELQRFFIDALRLLLGVECDGSVMEISICYDYYGQRHQINSLADSHLLLMQQSHTSRMLGASGKLGPELGRQETRLLQSAEGWSAQGSAGNLDSSEAGPFWIQVLGYIMLGTDLELGSLRLQGYSSPEAAPSSEDADTLLRNLPSSGTVVVVLRTESLRDTLVRARQLPSLFRGAFCIAVSDLVEEPASMEWASYRRPHKLDGRRQLAVCVLSMGLVLTLWTFLYIPWASFMQATLHDESKTAFFANTLMGLIISLGNTVVSVVVVALSDYVGFRHKSKARLMQLLVMIPCILLNVLCDFMVTARTVYFKYSDTLPDDIELQLNYGLPLLQQEIFSLLVPGYCILPYLAEPLFTVLLPLWIGILRVKSDSRISPDHAERLLIAGEVDIVNPYLCDLIVVTSTFCFTFIAPGKDHWKLFAALLVFACLTYIINRVRILRWQSATAFSTSALHGAECYLWGLPLGLLAAAFARQFDVGEALSRKVAVCLLGLALHVALHVVFVRYILPTLGQPPKPNTRTYSEAAKRVCTSYRNTNPVEVLKSRRKGLNLQQWPPGKEPESSPHAEWNQKPLVLYRPGREHLQDNSGDAYVGIDEAVELFGIPLTKSQASVVRSVAPLLCVSGEGGAKLHADGADGADVQLTPHCSHPPGRWRPSTHSTESSDSACSYGHPVSACSSLQSIVPAALAHPSSSGRPTRGPAGASPSRYLDME